MDIRKEIVCAFNDLGISVDSELSESLSEIIEDSLMFVSLIVEVEERLNIEIPSEYLDIDNFGSIESFVSAIEKIKALEDK